MGASVLSLYRKLGRRPLGRWLFSRLVCWKAPYFASVRPRLLSLEPGRGEASIRHRRRVTNHLGTVHAIALCNLAEFVGGLTTDVSLPAGMRWIPKGMQVEYLKKAQGTMRAVATPGFAPHVADTGYELPVQVVVCDPRGDVVFRARIAMWVSPRAAAGDGTATAG
ncbi:hotdog fold domain-containing protein [Luteimonas sp. R10]|uniref:hotdog fold domain-containing protein n=1 Tax=Luteimonas sp. R10 TaxID=3108176 RepID=UPI00309305CC|nr:hotdog fold domain-containing protein [Luteimonas sp. R10]